MKIENKKLVKTAKEYSRLSGQANFGVKTQEIITATDFSQTHKKDAPILIKSTILYEHHMIMN